MLAALVTACAPDEPAKPRPTAAELAYRRSLGIPDAARTVVVYSQSSHLDINWQRTFEEYQAQIVDFVINEALDLLDGDPKAVYSMAEVGFLRPWWARYPQNHARLRKYVAAGRFKFVGGGVTTPDTNLPPSESVIRDYVEGFRWLKENVGAEVTDAWIPDSFGHNPLTPDLLWGLGLASVGFSRLDGGPSSPFKLPPGLQKRMLAYEITPGSHAADLRDRVGQSFRWSGAGGASVQAMYMPYTYCLGDSLGAAFPIAPAGVPLNLTDDREKALGEMARYHAQMAPFDRTGYLFVPVGCDFQPPKELLTRFVGDWNRYRYASTGVWAVRASFEEFRKLVAFHDAALPRLALDGNPVWTGYFGERPRIKQLSYEGTAWLTGHELVTALFGRDLTAALAGTQEPAALAAWWWTQALSDHHDWIPGTALDRVWIDDQLTVSEQMVAAARASLEARLRGLAGGFNAGPLLVVLNTAGVAESYAFDVAAPELTPGRGYTGRLADGTTIPVTTVTDAGQVRALFHAALPPLGYTVIRLEPAAPPAPQVTLELRDASGAVTTAIADAAHVTLRRAGLAAALGRAADWSLTSVRDDAGHEWLAGPSDRLVVYHDTGGMYQIGSEHGCQYEPLSGVPAGFTLRAARVRGGVAEAVFEGSLYGLPVTREVRLGATGPLEFAATLRAPEWTTVVSRFETAIVNGEHRSGVGYGSVERPYAHLYAPSYWPASFSGLIGNALGAIVARPESTGFMADGAGRIEMMLKRNAYEEKCAELGAGGSDLAYDRLTYAFLPFAATDRSAAMAEAYGRTMRPVAVAAHGAAGGPLPFERSAVRSLTPGVATATLHEAGGGLVVRVVRLDDGIAAATLETATAVTAVTAVDLQDRPLPGDTAGWPTVKLAERFRSFRLLPAKP
jgi:alpha-mannosidase